MDNIDKTIAKINDALKGMHLPVYRKIVTKSGRNVKWLLRNIHKQNEVPSEVIEMLNKIGGK